MKEDPKVTNIGDNLDEAIMVKIIDLFHEFQDFFLTKFAEMKGILGDLGEMKILLKAYVKPAKKLLY